MPDQLQGPVTPTADQLADAIALADRVFLNSAPGRSMSINWPLGATLIIPILVLISVFIGVANRFGALGRTVE